MTQGVLKNEITELTPDSGMDSGQRREVADAVANVMADAYRLLINTQGLHWNVEGPMFNTLHLMFEEHYTELAPAVDEIAERIRALGVKAPGSYSAFGKLTSIEEATGDESAEEMIRQLVIGQETVARTAREAIKAAEAASDEPTADLLTQRMQIHEKNAWMLRSMLA